MSSAILDLHPRSRPSRSHLPQKRMFFGQQRVPRLCIARESFLHHFGLGRESLPHIPRTDDPCVCNSSSSPPLFRLVSSRLLWVFRCPSLTCIGFQRSVGSAGGAILSVSFLHLVDILRTPVHSIPATLFSLTPRLTFLLSVMPQSSLIFPPLPPPFPISALLSNGFLRPNPDGSLAIAKVYPSLRRLHRKVPF